MPDSAPPIPAAPRANRSRTAPVSRTTMKV